MGETVIEKIIRNNVGHAVKPGDIVTVNVDRVMIHDIFIPFVADKFEEMGFKKLWDPDKVVLIYDHLVPASQLDDTRHFHTGDAFAEKYGMKNVHRSDGICHQLMTEAGYVKPGNIVFGTDSHTTTYGCVGAFSSGIGYTEMASILGTGTMWIKVPETIKVVIEGELPENVMSKDVILRLIGDLGADGATYRALEFTGSAVKNMSVASRKIYRQAIELGILDTLAEAGAMITHPGCGLCCGRAGGILTDGESVVATNNRNFLGRMGTSKVEIYLASPKTAAAGAIAGKIVSPK